ncbi:MAG: hypothetical protein WKF30_06000 [Pyrinomonadaceae bacterium]
MIEIRCRAGKVVLIVSDAASFAVSLCVHGVRRDGLIEGVERARQIMRSVRSTPR